VLTAPYVTAAEFAAHPTYLDLDDLRSGISDPAEQVAELTNILLMASAWADRMCDQQLGAHLVSLRKRYRVNSEGNLQLTPTDSPVLAITSLSYGSSPARLGPASNLSAAWTENEYLTLLPVGGAARTVYVDWSYLAGWVPTILAADAVLGATSLTVRDPTGILPGAAYRLWEPGAEEAVTVDASYVPPAVIVPPAVTSIPLAAPTAAAHTSGTGWSGMPADMRLSIINYAVSQLMRPDTAVEDSYPDTQLSSGTRQHDPRRDGSGLVLEAERILTRYARVR
jgi:hypothetical protein